MIEAPKKELCMFWIEFACFIVAFAISACLQNWFSVFGWLCAMVWMLRFYMADNVLDRAMKLAETLAKRCGIEVKESEES